MKKIALIEKNKCNFEKIENYVGNILYIENTEEIKLKKESINEYIWSIIEPYIRFIETSDEDFMTIVCENIIKCFPDRKPDDFFYHTEGSYSFPKKYIELIYCQPIWKGYDESKIENMNDLACLFSLKHNVVENNCVIFCNKYNLATDSSQTNNNHIIIDSITKEDIIRVVKRRFFFSAILIKKTKIVKYYYQNPSFLVSKIFGLNIKDNIQKLPFNHLKYNLKFYFQHDKSKYVNKTATRINGSYQLYGDVLMIHEIEDNVYANISIRETKRLNVLSYGRLYDRQLKTEETHTNTVTEIDENGKQIEKTITPFWSRYIVLNNRMLQWKENKNKCIYCKQEMQNVITCDKCFRVKYCSRECKNKFKNYHDDECINPDSLL